MSWVHLGLLSVPSPETDALPSPETDALRACMYVLQTSQDHATMCPHACNWYSIEIQLTNLENRRITGLNKGFDFPPRHGWLPEGSMYPITPFTFQDPIIIILWSYYYHIKPYYARREPPVILVISLYFFGCAKHTAFTAAVCPSRDRKHPVLNQGSTHQNN